MLDARDERRRMQDELLRKYPGMALTVLTVVAPGEEKRNRNTRTVAFAGADALAGMFASSALVWRERDLPTGFELWAVVSCDPFEAKRVAVNIEETHPLGRLMDIDVIGADGVPISRDAVGAPPRKCLICGENARVCMRLKSHSYSDLIEKITRTVDSYAATL